MLCVIAVPAQAQQAPTRRTQASRLTHAVPDAGGLDVQPDIRRPRSLHAMAASNAGADAFLSRYGGNWEVRWDDRANRPNLIQGSGVPLFAGSGNALQASTRPHGLKAVESRVRAFLDDNESLLGLHGIDLRLDASNSTPYGDGADHWFVQFDQYHRGVRVEGASVFVRISHGNVVQFGDQRVAPVSIGVDPAIGQRNGLDMALRELPLKPDSRIRRLLNSGELVILPRASDRMAAGHRFTGTPGTGYDHVLAWHYVFRLHDDPATYEVYLDANTGRLLRLRDRNVYTDAQVVGNVYTTDHVTTQSVGMPFATISNGGSKLTDLDGHYDYSGGSASVALDGQYFKIVDDCGSISLSDSTDGQLDLGRNSGTDCSTPGFGGPGNTNASRSAFYNLTLINRKAITYFPSNSWLQGTVTAEVNENDVCNAYWDGYQLNFFHSSDENGCANTGELPGVFLHEWGHGMDTNTGGSASEYGSGEAVGDTFAMLETHDSCIGTGFFTDGSTCDNCHTSCTGVRDAAAFSLDAPPGNVLASPATIADDNGVNADALGCPYFTPNGFAYQGPMGYEGHHESYIASSANWDLAQALIDHFGDQVGWKQMNRIWYGSLVPSKSAYEVVSGGKCNVNAEVDGCGADNWYTVYLAADDDDGNLANGTPNACRIWDAFNAHGIACGARPACSPTPPDFYLQSNRADVQVCAGSNADVTIKVGEVQGYSNAVTLGARALASGVTATFTPNPVMPGNDVTMNIAASLSADTGESTLTAMGDASDGTDHTRDFDLQVFNGHPQPPSPLAPANASVGHGADVTLSWAAEAGAGSYSVEVATDSTFSNIIASATGLAGTSYKLNALDPESVYYWRVTAENVCGDSAPVVSSFITAKRICQAPAVAIPDGDPSTGVSDVMHVDDDVTLADMRVGLKATHPWVGDLSFTLSHGSTAVGLISRPGVTGAGSYGCSGSDIDVRLSDGAATSVQSQCSGGSPAIGGEQKPYQPLAGFNGLSSSGDWTLQATDGDQNETGTLDAWCLIFGDGVPVYTVGGHLSGMDGGKQLTLRLNGGNDIQVARNGSFVFALPLHDSDPYAVSVARQPTGQTCSVNHGGGVVSAASVANADVVCAPFVDAIFADSFDSP